MITRLALATLILALPLSAMRPAPARAAENSGTQFRNFYEVLDDLMGDFEYDLKNGQVQGLKALSIRNIATSENIPPSFRSHLELAITEKVLKTSNTKMIQCLPCRARRTTISGDQVTITSADTNPVELSRIAKMSNIEHFMDVAFAYQPSGMVLSLSITEPESGTVVWSRSYNSETSRASAFRRGVDYTQVDEARRATEYVPTLQHRATLYYLSEPDVGGSTGCLGIGYRLVERYDNRKKEVGFEVDYLKNASSLGGSDTTAAGAAAALQKIYGGGFNITLLFMHTWNLIGAEENYNQVRGSAFGGIGGTYASGFLGALIRGGYEWRLAKHWAVQTVGGYRPTGTRFLNGTTAGAVAGIEFGIGISGFL